MRDGVITRPQLYDALRLQRQNNRLLGTCLLTLGYIDAQRLLSILSQQLNLPALPPELLQQAAPAAVSRLSGELAHRLRVVPYSWDGEMLGVAIADGRILNHLHEVAYHTQTAVGAYLALETEIETALQRFYGAHVAASQPLAPVHLQGRPRPARTTVAEPPERPPTPSSSATAAEGRAPTEPSAGTNSATAEHEPPADEAVNSELTALVKSPPQSSALEKPPEQRRSFFEAIEQIYECADAATVGAKVTQALLNYFRRAVVLCVGEDTLTVAGYAGLQLQRGQAPRSALPLVAARLQDRSIAYGSAAVDPRAAELTSVLGLEPGATVLLASVGDSAAGRLFVFADNGDDTELYDDLHDVEVLLKEAETGLAMLAG